MMYLTAKEFADPACLACKGSGVQEIWVRQGPDDAERDWQDCSCSIANRCLAVALSELRGQEGALPTPNHLEPRSPIAGGTTRRQRGRGLTALRKMMMKGPNG